MSEIAGFNSCFPSGVKDEQKEGRCELNQEDSKDRGPALLSERGDRVLRHHLCASRLIVSSDGAATANNILASERLFRVGIVSELICAVEVIFLVWVLYRLLAGVSKTDGSMMAIFGLAFVPIMCLNVLSEIAALTLLRGADFLSALGQSQREALAMLFLDLHRYGYIVGWIFGPWLFFFGVLVFRSGFLPRILGVLLIAACFGYLADSLTPLLLPSYEGIVGRIANIPLTLGEPAIILWLLIRGAKEQPLKAAA